MVEYDWLGYGYATLLCVGGLIGYIKAGSVASLVMGTLSGCAAFFGVNRALLHQNVDVIIGVSFFLAFVMTRRFFSSGKMMPAGLVAMASFSMLLRYGRRLLR